MQAVFTPLLVCTLFTRPPRMFTGRRAVALSMNAEDDLEEDVARLRRSYYSTVASSDDGDASTVVYNHASSLHAQRADLLGMFPSLPVVYSSFPVLPQSQTVLDVWQRPDAFSSAIEAYTTMFEALLMTPRPWYYAHATTLERGRARGTGTLMRVVNTKRTSDGRLQVLAQGIGRLRIVNETQSKPFPRVDAQLLVDAEALLREEIALFPTVPSTSDAAASPDGSSVGGGAAGGGGTSSGGSAACGGGVPGGGVAAGFTVGSHEADRVCLASALARERAWWAHDAAGFEDADGVLPGVLMAFNRSVDVLACQTWAEEQAVTRVAEARDAWSEAGATAAAADEEYTWDRVCPDWFLDIEEAQSAEAAAEQARCERVATLEQRPTALAAAIEELREVGLSRAEELEVACWVELDALLRAYAANDDATLWRGMPAELLGLLPHAMPPCVGAAASWPEGFELFNAMRSLDGGGEARVDAAYPAWRRATRLSFALANVLAQVYADGGRVAALQAAESERRQTAPPAMPVAERLQAMLESASTSDRLRLALAGMQDARRSLA